MTFVLHLYHSHLSHLTQYLFQIFTTTFKMEDQRGIITIDIIRLIISMIITEEHGKTIDIIFIDAKQYDGRKNIRVIPPQFNKFFRTFPPDHLRKLLKFGGIADPTYLLKHTKF